MLAAHDTAYPEPDLHPVPNSQSLDHALRTADAVRIDGTLCWLFLYTPDTALTPEAPTLSAYAAESPLTHWILPKSAITEATPLKSGWLLTLPDTTTLHLIPLTLTP